MRDKKRLISSGAAIVISLASGSNYVYSAWAPQFAERLHLSATETNMIGLAGNLGMYTLGIPVGMFVDRRGPRSAVLAGTLLLGLGYLPFGTAYANATGSVPLLCFFLYLTGLGGCMTFAAAVKTSALNWPHHRGTATAFPVAAFGLSAFFFSFLGSLLFPGDTRAFLGLLAAGTSTMTLLGFFFLRVMAPSQHVYTAVVLPGLTESQPLRTTRSDEAKWLHPRDPEHDEGMVQDGLPCSSRAASPLGRGLCSPGHWPPHDVESASCAAADRPHPASDEQSSLISSPSPSSSSVSRQMLVQSHIDSDRAHVLDLRGWQLLRAARFWQLFSILGILGGIGLMTINNIGHDTNALWRKHDATVSEEFLIGRQQLHVSILSLASFAGRLLSGIGSDWLVKRRQASRVWCLVLASSFVFLAQALALAVSDPRFLASVSILSGLGYGCLYGVFPSIVAESFGIHALSQNWGFMTLSPVVSGNAFNLFYGAMFDRHSIVGPGGELLCYQGVACYREAYLVTLVACTVGLAMTLVVIRHQYWQRLRDEGVKGAADE